MKEETIKKIFTNKENRDKKYKELKRKGYNVKKLTLENQVTHPKNVEDYLHKIEWKYGTALNKTYFEILYIITERR